MIAFAQMEQYGLLITVLAKVFSEYCFTELIGITKLLSFSLHSRRDSFS